MIMPHEYIGRTRKDILAWKRDKKHPIFAVGKVACFSDTIEM